MSNLHRGPSYQVSIHLAMWFQRRRFFRNPPIRNKNCLWQPCLLTDRNYMSKLYRGLSKEASYQISIHLAKRFQRFFQKSTNKKQELSVAAMFVNGSGRNKQSLQRTCHRCLLPSFGSFGQVVSEEMFKYRPIRNKYCLWQPCLLMNQYKMSRTIDASYKVSLHLAEGFQRRLKCEKLTDDRRQPMAKSSHCLWQGELKSYIDDVLSLNNSKL